MYKKVIKITIYDIPDACATHFKDEVLGIVNETEIDQNVCNGTHKFNAPSKNFTQLNDFLAEIQTLQTKNCADYNLFTTKYL